MEEQHELYEYARKDWKKKRVVSSFCASIFSSLFLFVSTKLLILD
jgi:hypothetical protein